MTRSYTYVGPRRLAELATSDIPRAEPRSITELLSWLRAHAPSAAVTLTYVVTQRGVLRLSDRHSEHVACARGEPVLAAGEISLRVDGDDLELEAITNQSTGYCPEPSCFSAVAAALNRLGLQPPDAFSHSFVFRRCTSCQGITLVKDGDFECPVCAIPLPEHWNFDDERE